MHLGTTLRQQLRRRGWQVALLLLAMLAVWCAVGAPAATVAAYPFGRYEMFLQEGAPVAVGEIVGMVRRQTGLPEYPLMFGAERASLALNLLGPANRPLPLASAKGPWSAASRGAAAIFILERSVRQGDALVLYVRQVNPARRAILRVDLSSLERTLEGPR
jgi:hypothetical protein